MGRIAKFFIPDKSEFETPRSEYVQSRKPIGLDALARKWRMDYRTICRWSSLGKWVAERRHFWGRVEAIAEEERALKYARIRSRVHTTNARVASKALKMLEKCLDEDTPESLAKAAKLTKLFPGIAPLARERRIAYALELPTGVEAPRAADGSNDRPSVRGSLLGPPHPDVADPDDANPGDDIRAAAQDDPDDTDASPDTFTPGDELPPDDDGHNAAG